MDDKSDNWHKIALLVALCFHAACTAGGPSASSAKASSVGSSTWQLSVTVDGGLAGLAQRFSTDSDSKSILAIDLARGTRAIRSLTVEEQQALSTLVASRSTAPDVDLRTPSCADC